MASFVTSFILGCVIVAVAWVYWQLFSAIAKAVIPERHHYWVGAVGFLAPIIWIGYITL